MPGGKLLAIVPLFLLLAHSAVAATALQVMTFNVRYDSGNGRPSERGDAWTSTTGSHRRELIFQVISQADPDVLCVQEALVNQIEDLKASLPNHDFYGVGRSDGKQAGEYCGIFLRKDRLERLDAGNFWLNKNSEVPGSKFPDTCCARIATWVMLRDRENSDRKLLLINTHWDHQIQAAREFSAELIQKKLPSLASGNPVILAGDLNATPDNPAIPSLLSSEESEGTRLIDCYRQANPEEKPDEATYHDFQGRTEGPRIDYVLCTQELDTVDAKIIRTHEGERYPSDHYPVTVTLEWK